MSSNRVETKYGENIHPIFFHLIQLEKKKETLGHIDESGLFTCNMDRIPIHWVPLDSVEHKTYDDSKYLYVIPRVNGDILHSVRIRGRFQSAEIFQYSFLDGRIIYDHIDGLGEHIDGNSISVMCPFPQSGIPVLQILKNIYLEIIPENEDDPIQVEYGFGFLDGPLRKKMSDNKTFSFKGVSVIHKSGIRYGVFGMNAQGHSINVLGPEA